MILGSSKKEKRQKTVPEIDFSTVVKIAKPNFILKP
jgi:hypothetical protein